MDRSTIAYIEAGFWSSTDNSDVSGGTPLDENYGIGDPSPETQATSLKIDKRFRPSISKTL